MKTKIKWTITAANDLKNIISYIAADSKKNAQTILQNLKNLASTLYLFPEKGRHVPELKEYGILLYRELIYTPWRIIYKIEKNVVNVVAVFDGRRDLLDLLLERFLK
jgi:plasmid stabilization system protein ParE